VDVEEAADVEDVAEESVAGGGCTTGAARASLKTEEAMERANDEQRRPVLFLWVSESTSILAGVGAATHGLSSPFKPLTTSKTSPSSITSTFLSGFMARATFRSNVKGALRRLLGSRPSVGSAMLLKMRVFGE
jgi:hypothetical protein